MTPAICLVKVNSPIDKNVSQLFFQYAQPEKKERVLRQKVKQNADNMLVGEIFAKIAIKKIFGIEIAKQHFAYSEQGKPYLLDFPGVHFNISHSGEYIVCVVYDKPVGVDIQKICAYNFEVAKRVCNENELTRIEGSSDKASKFTKLWTQKEAVLKMMGTGIAKGCIKNCLKNQAVQSIRIDDYWVSIAESHTFFENSSVLLNHQ